MSWMDPCICMDESLHCSPETVIALLIFYAPKQNDLGVKKIKLKWNFVKKKKNFQFLFTIDW